MMAAMNGPGDTAKVSASAAKALKKAALAEAREAKKLAAAKKPIAKVIPMKKPVVKKPASVVSQRRSIVRPQLIETE